MKQSVIAIDKRPGVPPETKQIPANQKAVDALPLRSGQWRVAGIPGLYVRCRAQSRSFVLQRRIDGDLVKQMLGPIPLKDARLEAMRAWGLLKPQPASGRKTFEQAYREFMQDGGKRGELAAKTRTIYEYNFNRYLTAWKDRALEDIGEDEECGRRLYRRLKEKHGNATGYQVIRLVSAVWRHARRVNRRLPESPTEAVTLAPIKKRDWALSPEDLKTWGTCVKTLAPIKKMWWLTTLLTGARAGSIEALAWSDVDLNNKTIRFSVTKGDKPYLIPMSDLLAKLLSEYRDSGHVPPSPWLFPSTVKPEHHVVAVRDDKKGVASAHHLRHTFRTTLMQLGATTDQAKLLMGHSMGGDVSRGYITAPLVVESLRPVTNAVSDRLAAIIGGIE